MDQKFSNLFPDDCRAYWSIKPLIIKRNFFYILLKSKFGFHSAVDFTLGIAFRRRIALVIILLAPT